MNDNNTLPMGLLLGAIVPVLAFIVIETLFSGLESIGLFEEATTSALSQRERTIGLLAICSNLLPFNFSKKRKWDNVMRGIIFPTMIYVGGWLYRYHDILF